VRSGGPPKGGLAAAEFEDMAIAKIALCQKIDRGISVPGWGCSVGGTGRPGNAAFLMSDRQAEAEGRHNPVREPAKRRSRRSIAAPRCRPALGMTAIFLDEAVGCRNAVDNLHSVLAKRRVDHQNEHSRQYRLRPVADAGMAQLRQFTGDLDRAIATGDGFFQGPGPAE
jgi:hypothetical protein